MKMQAEMEQAQYLLIQNEQTTVAFILRGLAARPVYQTYVTTLMLQHPNTVQAAHSAAQVLQSFVLLSGSSASPWARGSGMPPATTRIVRCDYHQNYGTHSTNQYRDRARALARQHWMENPAHAQSTAQCKPTHFQSSTAMKLMPFTGRGQSR